MNGERAVKACDKKERERDLKKKKDFPWLVFPGKCPSLSGAPHRSPRPRKHINPPRVDVFNPLFIGKSAWQQYEWPRRRRLLDVSSRCFALSDMVIIRFMC